MRDDDDFQEKDSSERWLLTYSDMITLLLALFIILYGMSSINSGKFQEMSSGLEKALNNPSSAQEQQMQKDELEKIYEQLNKYIKENKMNDTVNVTLSNNKLVVHMKDNVLFQPDTAILLPDSAPILKQISKVIGEVYDKVDHVTITGNTADIGLRDSRSEMSAWQLSSDRAVRVLTALTGYGIPPDKLSIEGNSHYNPVATNDTESGRSKNRRVEIAITKVPTH